MPVWTGSFDPAPAAEGTDESGEQPDHGERSTDSEQDARVGNDTAEYPVEVDGLHAPTYGRQIGGLARVQGCATALGTTSGTADAGVPMGYG
jgi:hypothetical protein